MEFCTKKDLFETMDFEEGDKIFVVIHKKNAKLQRITHGFNWFELFGCLEMVKNDLVSTICAGEKNIKVTDITRIRILDEKDVAAMETKE